MSVSLWWLGADHGADYATVVVRCDATETVTVGCDGRTFTGAADINVNDGVVVVTVTGLTAGTQYAYTVNGTVGGTLRTKKASGEFWLAFGSCWNKARRDVLAEVLLADYDIDLAVLLGDLPYTDSASSLWGETTLATHGTTGTVAACIDPDNYLAHHRQARKIPGVRELIRSVPTLYMPDDHEYCYDNACPPNGNGNASHVLWQAGVPSASAYADFLTAWDACLAAIDAYRAGNPANSDAGIDADAGYTRLTIGPAEIFLIDCCRYRTPYTATDDASKTMLAAAQKAWLIAAVTSSTATFKIIASGKQLFAGGGNTDTWVPSGPNPGYITERNEILYALRNVTGMLWVAGDLHLWSDQWVVADELGAGYPAVSCLVACPTNVDLDPSGIAGYSTGVRSKVNGYPLTTACAQENVYGLLKVTADRVERYHLSSLHGLRSRGYVDADSNQVQYAATRIA